MSLTDFIGMGASGAAGLGLGTLSVGLLAIVIVVAIWKLIWYGLALYKAIELKEKTWFVVLFVCAFLLGDLGILAIIYLLIKKKKKKKR